MVSELRIQIPWTVSSKIEVDDIIAASNPLIYVRNRISNFYYVPNIIFILPALPHPASHQQHAHSPVA